MLKIKRSKMFVDSMRDYKIYIDGVLVGTVSNGEIAAFSLEEGHHLVHCEIDWCRSKKMSLDVQKDEHISLHVGSSMRWFVFPFLYLLKLSLFKNRYISLKKEKELLEQLETKYSLKKDIDFRKLQTIQF